MDKSAYIESMWQTHRHLFSYPELIARSVDVRGIRASAEGVFVEFASGVELEIPGRDQRSAGLEALNFRSFEGDESRLLAASLGRGQTFIDIGANIGFHTLHLARVEDARVIAVEPVPTTHALLERNVRRNGMHNVRCVSSALGRAPGRAQIYVYPEGTGNASLVDLSRRASVTAIEVPVTTLDDLCAKEGVRPDVIKCDVEGAELLVIEGGASTLREARPMVLMELLRKWALAFGYHPNDVLALMRQYAYDVFVIRDGRLALFDVVTEETVETNFVFVPRGRSLPSW
jgi:FkbM family methyltransferase